MCENCGNKDADDDHNIRCEMKKRKKRLNGITHCAGCEGVEIIGLWGVWCYLCWMLLLSSQRPLFSHHPNRLKPWAWYEGRPVPPCKQLLELKDYEWGQKKQAFLMYHKSEIGRRLNPDVLRNICDFL
jgi:hypothetical protein